MYESIVVWQWSNVRCSSVALALNKSMQEKLNKSLYPIERNEENLNSGRVREKAEVGVFFLILLLSLNCIKCLKRIQRPMDL